MSSLCRLTATAVSLLCALAVLSGCGDDESKSETGPKAQIVEFSADRTEIVEGESTTLRWSTREAASVILLENGIKRETGALPATGSVEITPARDTTYRLEATDAQGLVVARETAVTVAPLGPPTIEAFEASPTETRSGQVVNLMWQVRGGTQIEIVDQTGQVLFRGESKGAEGRLEVRPTTTTTYELRVHNAYGSATAEVEVVVALPPTVTLEADATQVAYGDEVTLSWVVRDATQVYVADPEGRILFEGPAEDGSLTVVAEVSGAYRATAMGTGGEASATVNVHIQPEILEFGAAVHGSARPGNIALVEWHVVGADRIAIFNGPSEVYETSRTQGQISAPIGTSGDFVLRAYSGSLMTEEHAQIQVREVPLIRRVTTGPMVTAGQGVAGVSTIGWEIDGASKLTIEVDPGGIVDVTDKSPRMDEVEIVFLGPGTVTVTAYNSSGHAEYVVESPVDPVPTFETFFAAPSRVHSGGTVQLHWETRDAVWVALEQDGVELAIDPSLVDGMVEVDSIVAPSTFVLRARNSLGHVVASEPVTVEVGAPNSLSFDTADGLRLYRVGTFVDLVWENDGGTELVVNDLSKATDNELCRITDPVLIRRGGCSIEMPSEQKPLPLELVVTNDSGSDRRTLDLQAVAGPIILEFYPDVPAITDGGSVLFSWVVMRDADGNVPILTLVDDRGVEYPMDGVDPIQGSKRFDVVGWDENPRVFTLTATSAVPPAYSLSTEVMVYGVPTVDSLSASPTFVEIEGQPVTIHWETTHGASLMIFPVDRDGNASDVPLFWTEDPDETAAGSTTFQPTKAVPNVRLVVTNPTGTSTEADLRIGVSPATIASFTANGVEAPQEVELVDGEDLTLAWEILRSDDALLLEEFVDISNRPNAIELGVAGTNANHKVVLDFPEGFVFPYDGGEYTTVAITNSGYLTFDPGSVVATGDLVIPVQNNANGSKLDIAPFWDSMVASDGSDGQLGTLWWEFVEGEVDRIVIQWTNYRFTTSTYNPADLTFQVVLYEDGRFEYRYGKMDGPHEATRARWATIGAQSRDCPSNTCPFGVQLVRQSEQVHGLEGRVYRFDGLHDYRADASTFPVPMDGSMTFKPAETRTYTLRSWNGHSEDEREIRVVVHPRARLQAWTEPLEPAPGEPVDLHWSGVALTSLVIEDEQGTVIHTASPTELESGSIALGAVPQGTYRYTLRGVGQLPRDQVVEEIDLRVYPPFSLDDFTVTPESIKYGETVTLSWAATNATSVQIEAFPGGMLSLPPTPDGGSVQHQPEETTTYVITLESHGRHRIEERTVEVRIAWIDDFQLSRTEVPFGGTVDLSWEIGDPTGEGQLTIEPFWRAYELREVTTDAPFQTIVGDGGVELPIGSSTATTGYSNVTFPAGFSFPFIGETKTSARAFNYGYLHFGTNQTSGSSTDFVMPRQNGTTYDAGVMGVFWGSLSKQSTGKIFGKFVQDASDPDKDHYIIEWANFQFSSTTYNPADLNFQIVLYRDGSFEYRYGNMTAANTAQANGSAIGIGYNVGNWGPKPYQLGYQLLYNLEMPGGMSNRSWRYEPLPKGPQATWSYQPNDSGPIRLCIETPKWKECEEQFLTVYKPGDVVISELMVDPGSGGTQWFEIRNLGAGPIDLEGKTLRIGSDTHTIQTGAAFLIPPGGHAVFAPAYDPDVDPDYVYGTSLVLGTPAGSVALEWDGMVLGETSWNSSWTFTPGVAKELLATKQRPGEESRSTAADYCDSAEPFGAGGRFGTPGTHGGGCATVHGYEVDFAANHPFIDIRDTGTPIYHFTSTAQTYEIPGGLGFTIPYFNGTASELWLNSYGLFGLSGSPSNSSANRNLGTGSGIVLNQGILSPFWDTMIIYGPESMVYWDRRSVGNNQVMIVQFHQYKYNLTSYPGYYEFQLQIWDNGDIAFVYGDIWRTHNITNTLRYYEGYSATIGLESFTSTEAILYLYAEARLRPFQSFYFKKL